MIEYGDYTCRECGEENPLISYYGNELMIERQMCFSCSHWTDQLSEYGAANTFVIDGRWYSDGGRVESGRRYGLGFGGREFTIQSRFGTVRTNNLWSGGEVPAHFRMRMPDTAAFIPAKKWVDYGPVGLVLCDV